MYVVTTVLQWAEMARRKVLDFIGGGGTVSADTYTKWQVRRRAVLKG
jgi:hypothetical protein